MQDPANPGDSNSSLEELRKLLVGAELDQLAALGERHAALRDRIDDPAKRSMDLAEALPAAIRAAKAKPLREALEPVFEKAFSSSVRKNPRELADAIYPIIGPAIRTSIAASIRDFAEALNQIVEKSVSLRSIQWRVESIITGKPFSEILMARSLLYSVEQMFLIHRKSGLLLLHVAANGSVLKDADMISGMLTAIQDFLSDSFTDGGQELETIDAGRFKLWLTYSSKVLLVGAVSGSAPIELRQVFRKSLDRLEELLGTEINSFKQDDLSVFEPGRPVLQTCLLGQSAPAKTKKTKLWPYVAVMAVAVILLLAVVGYRIVVQRRCNLYLESLRQRPGIVVTDIQRDGLSYVVSGLKDPQAEDPAKTLAAEHMNDKRVRFIWQPYLSLNTTFARQREISVAIERIQRQIVRFDNNSSKLAMSESERLEDLADAINRVLRTTSGAKITITGHADETGSAATNEKLSTERAANVGDALVAQGVPASSIATVGVGNSMPLRAGKSEWDRATNRGVSVQVRL